MTAFGDRSPLGLVVANSLRALLQDPQSCNPSRRAGPVSSVCTNWVDMPGPSAAENDGAGLSSNTQYDNGHSITNKSSDAFTPPQTFSGLLWELEHSGVEVGQIANYKKMEPDLRSVLGDSYDDLLSMI